MTSHIDPAQSSFRSKILGGIFLGTKTMLVQTPFVNSLNRVSVVCCFRDVTSVESIKLIYQGTIDKAAHSSVIHFFRGTTGHLIKETARIGFKASGLVLKPSLDRHFRGTPMGKLKSDLIFSAGLSFAEVLINPADTIRTMWQAGKQIRDIPKGKVLSHLYKGSGANGLKQFGIWFNFTYFEGIWSKIMTDTTSIEASSTTGVVVKSLPQALQITASIWIFERLKNELQYHPFLADNTAKNRYSCAFTHIRETQGWRGFSRGFTPKVLSNYILVIGANYLLELGRAS